MAQPATSKPSLKFARECKLAEAVLGVPFTVVEIPSDAIGEAGFRLTVNNAEFPQRITVEIPVSEENDICCLMRGEVSTTDRNLLEQLLALFIEKLRTDRLESSQSEQIPIKEQMEESYYNPLEECCNELSRYLDEISCLRDLTKMIESCQLTMSFNEALKLIMRDLCDVIAAESLAYVHQHAFAPQVYSPLEVIHRAGQPDVSNVDCCRIVEMVDQNNATAKNTVLVQNEDQLYGIENLSSLICVSMTLGDDRGWLLAFNKETSAGHRVWDSQHERVAEEEFGTVEAGLLETAGTILRAHHRNMTQFRQIKSMTLNVIQSISGAVDARDRYTRGHSERVARMAATLAEQIGLPKEFCHQTYLAGLLHDIGKIGIPDAVLNKPGRLTEEEYQVIQLHPEIGYEIIRPIEELAFALPGIRYHHECVDGSGYPQGLAGPEIPLMARILAVADGFDAMTSTRPYRDGMPISKAESILSEGAGSQWDANVVAGYFQCREKIAEIVHSLNCPLDGEGYVTRVNDQFQSVLNEDIANSLNLTEPMDAASAGRPVIEGGIR